MVRESKDINWNPETRKTFMSRSVVFNESVMFTDSLTTDDALVEKLQPLVSRWSLWMTRKMKLLVMMFQIVFLILFSTHL